MHHAVAHLSDITQQPQNKLHLHWTKKKEKKEKKYPFSHETNV